MPVKTDAAHDISECPGGRGSLGAGAWVQCKFQAKQRREQHLPLSHSRGWSNCSKHGSKTCLCLLLNLNPGHNHWELDAEILWRCKTGNRQSQGKKSVLYLVDLLPTGSTMAQLKLLLAQQPQDFRPQFSGTSDSALESRPKPFCSPEESLLLQKWKYRFQN